MTYQEYKKTYNWLVKHHPDVVSMFTDAETPEKIFKVVITNQEKSGSTWKTTEVKEELADFIYYSNVVDAVPFFRNLGGTETITKKYTKAGYIPVKIVSTSPGRDQRTIREFIYIK